MAVEAEARAAERRPGEGNAAFLHPRGGLVVFGSARPGRSNTPGHLTHLLYAPDLDRQYSPPTRRRALALTREAAACLGLPLIPVSHNGRALLDRFVNWERSHGGVLAGIGLALGGWFANVHMASSHDSNHLIPWGSNPDLDPLWSTERTDSSPGRHRGHAYEQGEDNRVFRFRALAVEGLLARGHRHQLRPLREVCSYSVRPGDRRCTRACARVSGAAHARRP